MLFFSMWQRTFRKSELDYKASLNGDNQPGRTHAAGALGGANEEGDSSSDSSSDSDSDIAAGCGTGLLPSEVLPVQGSISGPTAER